MESGTIQPLTIYEGAKHLKYISIGAILRYHHQGIFSMTRQITSYQSINFSINPSPTNDLLCRFNHSCRQFGDKTSTSMHH